jgi:hypothetical protein
MARQERMGNKAGQVPNLNGDDAESLSHEIFLWVTRFCRKELLRRVDRRNYVGKLRLSKDEIRLNPLTN